METPSAEGVSGPFRVLAEPSPREVRLVAGALRDRPDVVIVLTWLTRLRWFALGGQLAALLFAASVLSIQLPLPALLGILAVTAATNVVLVVLLRCRPTLPGVLVPAVLVLDVVLLTGLLAATGGPVNPFCELYLIHVAMAVAVLSPGWTWAIAGCAVAGYASLFLWHSPLESALPLTPATFDAGSWIALTITAGLIVYFIGRLRSSLREREEQLAAMRAKVEEGERLAGIASLAAGAAHELGTPLGTIAVVAKELERNAEVDGSGPRLIDDVRLIRAEVDRCRRILDRMNVENLRRSVESPSWTTPAELLTALADELKAGQIDALDCRVEQRLGGMKLARGALVQVLGILLQNAFEACDGDQPRVSLRIEPAGRSIRFVVKDDGRGMEESQLARLGEPFHTTKPPAAGMGLGLFLARSITEHVGGRLVVQSVAGQGTAAVLEFPGQWRVIQQD